MTYISGGPMEIGQTGIIKGYDQFGNEIEEEFKVTEQSLAFVNFIVDAFCEGK